MDREHIDALQTSLRTAGIIKDDAKLASFEEGAQRISTEVARLRGVETQFTQYREAEVADALAQGIRAFTAEKFDKERYTKVFESADLATIRSFRTEWQAKADAELDTTRVSNEGDDPDGNR